MTKEERFEVLLMQSPEGKWVWTAAEAIVEFIPKGRRKPTVTKHLGGRNNVFDKAYIIALGAELVRYSPGASIMPTMYPPKPLPTTSKTKAVPAKPARRKSPTSRRRATVAL